MLCLTNENKRCFYSVFYIGCSGRFGPSFLLGLRIGMVNQGKRLAVCKRVKTNIDNTGVRTIRMARVKKKPRDSFTSGIVGDINIAGTDGSLTTCFVLGVVWLVFVLKLL
ncbi:hypothetical protein JTE90_010046 [Oedothorax gibbosus]|uniref:Uncharacterized protein n=1 Tax=Oedothorax gibbosus TaxID=931172 RepID=A0AAV6V3Y7_9ARAC|nr:hypothetical protein JTE90_010046 [Oedothorax gibbosus]